MLKENNTRKGFFEYPQYVALRDACPNFFRPVATFGFYIPWREENILELEWLRVDTINWVIRVDVGDTKNEEGNEIVLDGVLLEMIKAQYEKRIITKADGTTEICPYVFHRNDGRPITKDIRKIWRKACIEAGLGKMVEVEKHGKKRVVYVGKYFHDLRRTAIRDHVRSGVPERVVMTISGHKTRSVFDRYNIVSPNDLREAAERRTRYAEEQEEKARKVVPLKKVAG
jgi:hypothetical protein